MQAASIPSARRAASASLTPPTARASIAPRLSSKSASGYSTPVCCLPSSAATSASSGNSSSCSCGTIYLTNIPDPAKRSPTSGPASTSRGPDFYEYWDSSKKELYDSLLWPPETGSPASASSSSSGSVQSVALSSSFSTLLTELPKRSSEQTLWPSYRYTVVDGTADGATAASGEPAAPPKLKTLKLRLRPTAEQRRTLEKWAGCSRFTYNRAVGIRLAEGSTQKDVFRIRDRIVTAKPRGQDALPNPFFNSRPWLLECPKSIRQAAVKTAVANVKACFSNLKAKNIARFTAPFQSKKVALQRGWAMELDRKNVVRDAEGHLYVFRTLLGEMRYCSTKQLRKLLPAEHPGHDPKLQKTAFGEYFLVLSVDCGRRERTPTSPHLGLWDREPGGLATASIDPGVRKTLTTFSPENSESFMLGKGQATALSRLLLAYDSLLSQAALAEDAKRKRELRGKALRLRKRIFYLKKEFRDQVANFLAKRYDVLLVPKLGTKDMALCAGRTLKTKVVRQMLSLGHASIFERLREKCAEYGTAFLQVQEHYTSQTCLRCGCLNRCNETYRCHQCRFTCDRDVAGAAGIFLKSVRDKHPSERK